MMPKDFLVNNTGSNNISSGNNIVSGECSSGTTLTTTASVTTAIIVSSQSISYSSVTAPTSPAISVVSGTFYHQTVGGINTQTTPLTSTTNGSAGFSAHKNSLKSNKLARRARSFKDDLFEKISLMRTPTNTLGRSQSPQSPRTKNQKSLPTAEEVARSSQSLDTHVKDISNALKHFRDVVLKRKLEVLPGNGTVILETIASMYAVIQSYMLNENSATLLSATQQVYQSLARLIKLCDEVLLCQNMSSDDSHLLSSDNVKEIVDLLEDAVRNLASLAQEKLKEKEILSTAFSYGIGKSSIELSSGNSTSFLTTSESNRITSTTTTTAPIATIVTIASQVEASGQRTSLPDITLTPKERNVLEQNSNNQMRVSYSTESILRETSPPPKPPLPNRYTNPPPLPPKRNSTQMQIQTNPYEGQSLNPELENSNDFPLAVIDHLSVHSRSPDDNSSQCSLDSSMNHSSCRDEEHGNNVFQRFYNIINDEFNPQKSTRGTVVGGLTASDSAPDSDINHDQVNNTGAGIEADTGNGVLLSDQRDQVLPPKVISNHRHSNESGFISINSFRTSSQSYSKRSSDFSFQSSTKSSNSSTDVAYLTTDNNGISEEYTKYIQQSTKSTVNTISTSLNCAGQHSGQIHLISSEGNDRTDPSNRASVKEFASVTSDFYTLGSVHSPPALPPKTHRSNSSATREAQLLLSQDIFDTTDNLSTESNHELAELRQHHHPQLHHHLHHLSHHQRVYHWPSKHTSLIEQRHLDLPTVSCNAINTMEQLEHPPPLPMKKKHILAYMEICSATTRSVEQHRHTMHAYNLNRNISHSHTMNIVPLAKEEVLSPDMDAPPALPPKTNKQWRPAISAVPQTFDTVATGEKTIIASSSFNNGVTTASLATTIREDELQIICPFVDEAMSLNKHEELETVAPTPLNIVQSTADTTSLVILEEKEKDTKKVGDSNINNLPNIIEEVDVTPYLVFKKDAEDGPEVKGGYIDALIIHASHVQKVTDNAFSEAFITTFRTFIQPIDVIEKLIHRYTVFSCQSNDKKQKATKETFSLLVRVVNDLSSSDLTGPLLTLLVEFVYQLVCAGQLYLAKLLRNKIVEKVTIYKELRMPAYSISNEMFFTVTNQPSLLDLKSVEIAEQMTLLDAELFQKIEIPEVLLFAKEQCEEKSPNLNKFTEHFNKMSYWARSKILTLGCAKEREKHVIKFIKIMKHLRKMNNYNSYLALLSALDSAPIRRLEWHKAVTDGLKEYCTLIDSSSSFRAYRQALADTQPPCIPYIGLVLQDLTFVHVGNPDCLKEGVINFSKRWQQYNIIDNMKRFKKCAYPYRRNDRIIRFFENFENFLGEEQMWEISETIKPRGKRTIVNN